MDSLKLVKPDCMVKHIKDTVKVIPDIIPSIPHMARIKTNTSFLFTSDGTIGLEALERIVKHPALAGKPFILETPCNLTEYQQEIALVNSWLGEA